MMSPAEEQDLEKTIELVLKHAGNPESQRTSLRAALQLSTVVDIAMATMKRWPMLKPEEIKELQRI